MFREKQFLIKEGLYEKSREDVFFLVGIFYDSYIENRGNIEKEEYLKISSYLDDHRGLIDNLSKDIPIADFKTIKNRLREITKDKIKDCEKRNNTDYHKKHRGIYGIYVDYELVYIGETTNNFNSRFIQHRSAMKREINERYKILNYWYKEGRKVTGIPLIVIEDLEKETKRKFTEKEIKCMELALIKMYKPVLNVQGVKEPYHF